MSQSKPSQLEQYARAILSTGTTPYSSENLELVVSAAHQVLRDKIGVPQSFSPLILVVLAAETRAGRGAVADLHRTESRRRRLLAAYPRYAVFATISQLQGKCISELEQNLSGFNDARTLTDQFEAAVLPRRLEVLARKPNLPLRIAAWYRHAQWAKSDLLAHARRVFGELLNTPESIAELCGAIPVRRLATYTDDGLRQIAVHYQEWSGLVYLLTQNQDHSGLDSALKQFGSLRKRLVHTIVKMRGSRFSEDAVDTAMTATIRLIGDPNRGYTYEQDFFQWLLAQAIAEVARLDRASRREGDLDLSGEMGSRSVDDLSPDRYDFTVQHVCRLYFVQHLFEDHRERLRQLWFLRLMYDDALSDAILSKLLAMDGGEHVSARALGIMRFRLRQRLAVLEYILDVHDGDNPDSGSIELPLTYAGNLAGGGTGGSHALLRAAAYGWTARADRDPLLLYSTVVCAAFECRDVGIEEAIRRGGQMLELWRSAGGVAIGPLAPDEMAKRFERLRRWCASSGPELRELRRIATKGKVLHLVGVCIYLRIVQLRSVEHSQVIIQPRTSEGQQAWRSMLKLVISPPS